MIKKGLFLTLTIIAISWYFFLDRELLFFGESCFEFYQPLPFHIKPENRPSFEGGFLLWDSSRESLVGKGVKYWGYDSIEIDKIVAYGFNNTMLVAVTRDLKDKQHIFKFSKPDPSTKFNIKVELINGKQTVPSNLTWIDVLNQNNLDEKITIRNWLGLLSIGLTIFFITQLL